LDIKEYKIPHLPKTPRKTVVLTLESIKQQND